MTAITATASRSTSTAKSPLRSWRNRRWMKVWWQVNRKQLGNAEPGDSEDYFSRIPFEKVFHEGSIGGDRSIIEHRCAEVLAPSPLPLANHLQWVFCRTAAERDTLLCLLGGKQAEWSSRIHISDDLLLFERRHVFVDSVFLSSNGINFQLSPRGT
jgi:hypothetical protein